ncbi:alpha/beta-hydrolase [Auriscalpium vulgare]|uniref:Alpha/beta-hydrolase n=1 Tax=Auriscalpium vulgare TaxID=40419 RepID=A0ACB8RL74_9AGAM|nr:alpha/beta-hydrolase [Auriscalpium vulgare]
MTMSPHATLAYKTTAAGQDIYLDVYTPSTSTKSPVPVLVWFHIGGLTFGGRADGLFPSWLLAAAQKEGWILVSPDYRLLPEANIDEILSDVKDVWSYVHTQLNGELSKRNLTPARLTDAFVGGASAGGYLAWQAGHLVSPTPKAVVTIYGYGFDHPSFFRTAQPADGTFGSIKFNAALAHRDALDKVLANRSNGPQLTSAPWTGDWDERAYLLAYLVATGRYFSTVFGEKYTAPSSDPAVAYLWPSQSITPAFPPTLLVHGTADSIAPYSESEGIAGVLAEKGVAHELVGVPGQEHLFDLFDATPGVDDVRTKVVAFLAARVGV